MTHEPQYNQGNVCWEKTNSKQGYEDNFFSKAHFYQLLQLTDTHRKNKQM